MALTKELIRPYNKEKRTALNKMTAPRYTNTNDIPRILDKIYDDLNTLFNAINLPAVETRSTTQGKVGDLRVVKDNRTGVSRIEAYTEEGWGFVQLRLLDNNAIVINPLDDLNLNSSIADHSTTQDVGYSISAHAAIDIGGVYNESDLESHFNTLVTKINETITALNDLTATNTALNSLATKINQVIDAIDTIQSETNSSVNAVIDTIKNY